MRDMVTEHRGRGLLSPPPAALAFSVGIVGHRPGRLTSADLPLLGRVLGDLLTAVWESVRSHFAAFGGAQPGDVPVLRAISPLAEGADQIFAEQALARGYQLVCPFPFPQSEYEKDFEPGRALGPDVLSQFRRLLASAHTAGRLSVVELPGDRRHRGEAYRQAGAEVAGASDLLVVVWDGAWRGSTAGTEGALKLAAARQVPTVWVDASAPHNWRFLDVAERRPPRHEAAEWDHLRAVVVGILEQKSRPEDRSS